MLALNHDLIATMNQSLSIDKKTNALMEVAVAAGGHAVPASPVVLGKNEFIPILLENQWSWDGSGPYGGDSGRRCRTVGVCCRTHLFSARETPPFAALTPAGAG